MNVQLFIKKNLLAKHFGCHVLRTATVSCCEFINPQSFFAETEISDFKISMHVNHDIFWFNVSIDDVLVVKVLDSC